MNKNSNNNVNKIIVKIPNDENNENVKKSENVKNNEFFDYFINFKLNEIFHETKIPTIEESMRIYNFIYLSNSNPNSNDKAFKIKGLRIYNRIYDSLSKITMGISDNVFNGDIVKNNSNRDNSNGNIVKNNSNGNIVKNNSNGSVVSGGDNLNENNIVKNNLNENNIVKNNLNENNIVKNNFNDFFILFKKCKKFTEYLATTFSYIDRFFVKFNKKSPEDFLWVKFINLFYKNCLMKYENEISISFFNELKLFRKITNNKTKILSLKNEEDGFDGIIVNDEVLTEKEKVFKETFNDDDDDEYLPNNSSQRYQKFSFFSKFYKNLLKHCNSSQKIDIILNKYLNGLDLYFTGIFEDKFNSKKEIPENFAAKIYGPNNFKIKSSKDFPAHRLLKAVTLEMKFSKLAFDDKNQYSIASRLNPYKIYIEDYLTYCLKNFKSFKYSIIVIQYMNRSNIEDFKKIYKYHVNKYLNTTKSEVLTYEEKKEEVNERGKKIESNNGNLSIDEDKKEDCNKRFKKIESNNGNLSIDDDKNHINKDLKFETIHKSYRQLYNQILSNNSQYLCYDILENEIKILVEKLNSKDKEHFINLIGTNMNKSIINNSKRIINFKIKNHKIHLNKKETKFHNELVRKVDYYLFDLYKTFYNFNLKNDYLYQTQKRLLLNISDIDVELRYEKEISSKLEKHSILIRTLNSFKEGHGNSILVNYKGIKENDRSLINNRNAMGNNNYEVGNNYNEIGDSSYEMGNNYNKMGNNNYEVGNNYNEIGDSSYGMKKETKQSLNNSSKPFVFKLFKLVDFFWVKFYIHNENSENIFKKIVNLFNFDIPEKIKIIEFKEDSKIQYFIKNDLSQIKFKILNCRIISNNFDFLLISLIAKGRYSTINDKEINLSINEYCGDFFYTSCDMKYLINYTGLSKKFIIERLKVFLNNGIIKDVFNKSNSGGNISKDSLFEIDSESLIKKSKTSKKTFTINIYYLKEEYLKNCTTKNGEGDKQDESNNLINKKVINKGKIMMFMKRAKRANLKDLYNLFADINGLDDIINGLVDSKYLEYFNGGLNKSEKFIDYVL